MNELVTNAAKAGAEMENGFKRKSSMPPRS